MSAVMRIIIHDLNFDPPRVYQPTTANDCKDAADRSAFELATQLNSTVTCGKVVAEVQRGCFSAATLGSPVCTPTVTNKDRARWAHQSVDASQKIERGRSVYLALTKNQDFESIPEYFRLSTKDLITNIIHLCDREGWSFEEMVESAVMHHNAETRTEEVQS